MTEPIKLPPSALQEALAKLADAHPTVWDVHYTDEVRRVSAWALRTAQAADDAIAAERIRAEKAEAERNEARAELARLTTLVSVAEAMPAPGVTVLAYYKNELGMPRRVRAEWHAAKTVEANIEGDIGEYDEATDAYWVPEGWYEQIDNWDDYSEVFISNEVTHWTPLPPVKEST